MNLNKKIILVSVLILVFSCFTYFIKSSHNISYDLSILKDKKNIVPVLIIGSGPAGCSAAVYTSRIGYNTYVLKGDLPGGQLTQTSDVENWPGEQKILGSQLMMNLENQAISFGVKFISESVTKVNFSRWPFVVELSDGNIVNALVVIIATGATPRTLNIPGEQEYWGKGVTTCAICDARFYQGRDVVVVGGGDSAAEEAMQLSAYAKSITILVRKEAMRASKAMIDHISKIPHIKISFNKEVKAIKGDNKHVNSIDVYDNKTKTLQSQPIDGVFLAIGHEPNTKLFEEQLKLDNSKYIVLKKRSQKTSVEGVFAAGDVADFTYRQAGVAAGDGIKAALDAAAFLTSQGIDFEVAKSFKSQEFDPRKIKLELESVKNKFQFDVTKNKNEILVVDFYGNFCPPCKKMLPIFEELAAKFVDRAKFIKVNTEENEDLVMEYKVVKIPCFVILKNGQEVDRKYGILDRDKMSEWIDSFK